MESRAQISEGMDTSTAAALPPYSPMSMSTIPGLELEMYSSEALWTDDGRGLEMDMDILHQGTGVAEASFGIDSSPSTEQEQDPESNVLPPTENAMEQLSALSGRLLGHVQALSTTPTELSPINDSQMPQLQQLAANVIESSVAFHRILSTAQRSLLDGLDPTGSLVTDTAAILQILAAYIRLTQLHYALYQRVRCILRFTRDSPCTESSDPDLDSTTAPFPSLHIGGVSLSAYPRFQLKFLLQICVHHLGEVEALLGLPAGFCVSERVVESRGILAQGAGEMPLLVLSIMRQAEQTVKSIRSVLAELAEETRGRIVV
nr:hypothetical protein [Aspergillus sp.]